MIYIYIYMFKTVCKKEGNKLIAFTRVIPLTTIEKKAFYNDFLFWIPIQLLSFSVDFP